MSKTIYLLDIDGVMANPKHRLFYKKSKDYDGFYSSYEILKDEPIYEFFPLQYMIFSDSADNSHPIYLITGRPERTRLATMQWLQKHIPFMYMKCVNSKALRMRQDGDHRPSPAVKAELVTELLGELWKEDDEIIDRFVIIDDDPKNVIAMKEAIQGYAQIRTAIIPTTCLTMGTHFLLNDCEQNTSYEEEPDTDKKHRPSLLSAIRERLSRRH